VLATQLRRRRHDLPIVLMSGYSGPLLTQQALAAGVSELLAKPLQSRQFAATLDRVLHHNEAPTPVQNHHPRTIPFP
jgi:FixJ family two-component response regulator